MHCNVCGSPAGDPIYVAATDQSLTSLCKVVRGRIRVWSCQHCSHLFGPPLPDTASFYENDYKILLDYEDEDQIYTVDGDKVVYRTEHQVNVLLDIVLLKPGARVLDYGSAKAAVPGRLHSLRSDLQLHLFDVSEMYRPFWNKLVPAEQTAVHATPSSWNASFDLVTSFFALEHIPGLHATLFHVHSLIAEDGIFYGIVPDTFGNIADFVVIDHVNHFTAASLHRLLSDSGFGEVTIDDTRHRGALVFKARKGGVTSVCPDPERFLEKSLGLAEYWSKIKTSIEAAEDKVTGEAAIYGSGFYGAFIMTNLQRPERVRCFLDHSPFQQGKILLDRPIISVEALSREIEVVYVGLNPAIARSTIKSMPFFDDPRFKIRFLDGLRE